MSLWPADSRPYIGGSQDNSILELTLGYNGFGRLTGDEVGSVGGGGSAAAAACGARPASAGCWATRSAARSAGCCPPRCCSSVAGLWLTRRARRTDPVRAGLVIWGGWLVVTAATFSFMAGIFHAYYTVALAPAIGALVGTGAWLVWRHRTSLLAAGVASAAMSLTAVLAFSLLGRTADFLPWLRWVVLFAGLWSRSRSPASAGCPAGSRRRRSGRAGRRAGRPRGVRRRDRGHAAHRLDPERRPDDRRAVAAARAAGMPRRHATPSRAPTTGGATLGGPQARRRGGLLNGSESTDAITALLQEDADHYTWVAAAVGSNTASGYQLASEEPVMAIGGFNGSDPSPDARAVPGSYVADGEIHYFIAAAAGVRRQPDGRQQRQQRHRRLGGGELQRDHGRRRHPLRPDQRTTGTTA